MKTLTLLALAAALPTVATAQFTLPKYVDLPVNAVADPGFEHPEAHAWDNSQSTWYDTASPYVSQWPWGWTGQYLPHSGGYCWDFWATTNKPSQSDLAVLAQTLSAPVEVSKLSDASVWVQGQNRTLFVRFTYDDNSASTAQYTLPATYTTYQRWDLKPYLLAGKRVASIRFSAWAYCDSLDPLHHPIGFLDIDDVSLTRIVRTYL